MPVVGTVILMTDFFTIEKPSVFEETEKRSRFISYSFEVSSAEDVKLKLEMIKTKHWDAKHCVYAYSLAEASTEKFSDDGEPGGTAGMPVLNAIRSENLTNTLVIVVRYFGGILLGTPGLRKMYGSGATNVLKISNKVLVTLCAEIEIQIDYRGYNNAVKKISDFGGKVLKVEFGENVQILAAVPKNNFEDFCAKISRDGCAPPKVNFNKETYVKLKKSKLTYN